MSTDYGELAPVVRDVGCLLAVGSAIALGWKGRARWEPCEEDVPTGPQRVASLLTAVGIGLLWSNQQDLGKPALVDIALGTVVIVVVALLTYTVLTTVYVYEMESATSPTTTKKVKIIGGFFLTAVASEALKRNPQTLQRFFQGAAFETDSVWPRLARGLAKATFIVAYLALAAGGTLALAATALAFGFEARESKRGGDSLAVGHDDPVVDITRTADFRDASCSPRTDVVTVTDDLVFLEHAPERHSIYAELNNEASLEVTDLNGGRAESALTCTGAAGGRRFCNGAAKIVKGRARIRYRWANTFGADEEAVGFAPKARVRNIVFKIFVPSGVKLENLSWSAADGSSISGRCTTLDADSDYAFECRKLDTTGLVQLTWRWNMWTRCGASSIRDAGR